LGAQEVKLGEGLRQSTLFFPNFNQEFQVRGSCPYVYINYAL